MATADLPRLRWVEDSAPPVPREPAAVAAVGTEIWHTPDGRVFGASCWRSERWIIDLDGIGQFRFPPGADEVEVVVQPGCPNEVVTDHWLRQVLPLVLQANGTEVLHASAVRTESGVVAFSGHAGAGKSTLAWALSHLGFPLVADDALPFEPAGDGFVAKPVSFQLRLRPDVLGQVADPEKPTRKVAVQPAVVGSSESCPVACIVLLSTAENEDDVGSTHAVSASSAFIPILEQAWGLGLSEPARRRQLIERYLGLTSGVRVLRFVRGTEPSTVDAQARGLIRDLGLRRSDP